MFKAIVETKSHEGGLLAPFTGSSPALGSIIVRVDDGTYIGKIDAVLGNTDSPIAHIAHLDRKMNPDTFLGCEAQIRPKMAKRDDNRQRSDRYEIDDRGGRRDDRIILAEIIGETSAAETTDVAMTGITALEEMHRR